MSKEVYLIKRSEGKFSQFIIKIRMMLAKFIKKDTENQIVSGNNVIQFPSETQKEKIDQIDDFEYLKEIIQGKINIKDLDKDLKKRLINLCNERLIEVNKEIEKKERQIQKSKELLENINNM